MRPFFSGGVGDAAFKRLLTASSARAGRTTELVTNTYDDVVASFGKGLLKSASVSEGGTSTISTTYT